MKDQTTGKYNKCPKCQQITLSTAQEAGDINGEPVEINIERCENSDCDYQLRY